MLSDGPITGILFTKNKLHFSMNIYPLRVILPVFLWNSHGCSRDECDLFCLRQDYN